MAYNISKGPKRSRVILKNEDDVDTLIDWDQNKITFKTDNVGRLVVDNNHVSGSGAIVTVGNAVFGGALNVSGNIFVANTKVIGRDDGTTRKANIQFADVGPSTNPAIVFRNGGSDLMVVDGGGNVGVGNTSPPHKLTIDGVVSGSGLITGASFCMRWGYF